ncbi:hypothetical protein SAMN06269250_2902 [Spirosoma fluviale]|uniref:Uncharacterized protein n=1 Tax=Spirosoma fluviale TaxID=1597977 RepID=A0A286G137_9BACT|nr:hypothetical protein SAMN06269250_2902 [Spirosoma fluviale]
MPHIPLMQLRHGENQVPVAVSGYVATLDAKVLDVMSLRDSRFEENGFCLFRNDGPVTLRCFAPTGQWLCGGMTVFLPTPLAVVSLRDSEFEGNCFYFYRRWRCYVPMGRVLNGVRVFVSTDAMLLVAYLPALLCKHVVP